MLREIIFYASKNLVFTWLHIQKMNGLSLKMFFTSRIMSTLQNQAVTIHYNFYTVYGLKELRIECQFKGSEQIESYQ